MQSWRNSARWRSRLIECDLGTCYTQGTLGIVMVRMVECSCSDIPDFLSVFVSYLPVSSDHAPRERERSRGRRMDT